MIIWPSTDILPNPDQAFNAALDTATLRLAMEDGRTRQRRRFSTDRLVISIQWTLTEFEKKVFTAFLKYKLNEATDPFFFPLDLGYGLTSYVARFINGQYQSEYIDVGFWQITAQLEITFTPAFCYPSVYQFLADYETFEDLSAYFKLTVASPGSATAWRLISDTCSGSIVYASGDIDSNGKMLAGEFVAGPGTGDFGADVTGFNSADFRFWQFIAIDFGVYLQVNCAGKWPPNPCIGYDLPTIPSVTFASMVNDPRNASLIPPNGTYTATKIGDDHWLSIHSISNGGGGTDIPNPITWQLEIVRDSSLPRFIVTFYPTDGQESPSYGLGGAYSESIRKNVLSLNRNNPALGIGIPGAFNSGTIYIN